MSGFDWVLVVFNGLIGALGILLWVFMPEVPKSEAEEMNEARDGE